MKPIVLTAMLGALAMVAAASAETRAGSLTSEGSVTVDGIALPVSDVPAWPLESDSVIETGGYPAIVLLRDRTRLALGKDSKVRLQKVETSLWVDVLRGNVDYRVSPEAETKISARGTPVEPGAGSVSITENGIFIPRRGRPAITTPPPPGLRPRSPSSPCAADPQVVPPRSPCAQGEVP